MEFKGTKVVQADLKHKQVLNSSGVLVIANINDYSGEGKYNTLLYSKAPKMLEMLNETKDVIKWYMDNSTSELSEPFFNIGANQIEQIEQLIKQATEI